MPFPKVMGFSQLPDFFIINGKTVNPVDMAFTLAHIIKGKLAENEVVVIMKGNLAPQRHINTNENWGDKWVIFPDDFTAANIIKMAKLQTWTLKPAIIK